MPTAVCRPGTRPVATSVPKSATPRALPICRAALNTAAAAPLRSPGAASITAAVEAGMVSAVPKPAQAMGATSARYGAPGPATSQPASPAAPTTRPATMGSRGPVRAVIRPAGAEPAATTPTAGSSAHPVRRAL